MLVIQIKGGLASQIQKYCVGWYLSKLNGVDFKTDLSWFNNRLKRDTPWEYSLGYYGLNSASATWRDLFQCLGLALFLLWLVTQMFTFLGFRGGNFLLDFFVKKFNTQRLKYFTYGDLPSNRETQSVYYCGEPGICFVSLSAYRAELIKLLHLNIQPSENAAKLLSLIKQSKFAVAVHVRRGDYLSNSSAHATHVVQDEHYYRACYGEVLKNSKIQPDIFVFSDDSAIGSEVAEWFGSSKVYHSYGLKNFEDFELMRHCHSHIISASGFSAFAAWLNYGEFDDVYYPKHWFRDSFLNSKTISEIPAKWILVG